MEQESPPADATPDAGPLALFNRLRAIWAKRWVRFLFAVGPIALLTIVMIVAIAGNDQGRDLLQSAQDQQSAVMLFWGLATAIMIIATLAFLLGGGEIDFSGEIAGTYVAIFVFSAVGMAIYAGILTGSVWTGFKVYFLAGFSGALATNLIAAGYQFRPRLTLLLCGAVSLLFLGIAAAAPASVGRFFQSPMMLATLIVAWALLIFAVAGGVMLPKGQRRWLRGILAAVALLWIGKGLVVASATGLRGYPILDYVRTLDRTTPPPALPLDTAYARWVGQNGPPPQQIVLVAAAGGGIRASYWTSLLLTRLVDRAPGLRRSLFASSGVSGGSLGLALFYGLLSSDRLGCAKSGARAPCVDVFHERDFLAGPLAATIAGLPANALLPLFPSRNFALETAWEHSWSEIAGPNGRPDIFAQPFSKLWPDGGSHPLLLLNATSAISGERAMSSDVALGPWFRSRTRCRINLAEQVDLPLSAAAGASARFPFVSDWGWIRSKSPDCDSLEGVADGGFFDNYGAATLLNLITGLAPHWAAADAVKPQIIVIQITSDPSREMGCLFKYLDRDGAGAAVPDYCVRPPRDPKVANRVARALDDYLGVPGMPQPRVGESLIGMGRAIGSAPTILKNGFFGMGGPGVLDVVMEARAINGIDVAEQLRDTVCRAGGSYYHFAMTGAQDIPLGWALSRKAQRALSALLDSGRERALFDRLAAELADGRPRGQCETPPGKRPTPQPSVGAVVQPSAGRVIDRRPDRSVRSTMMSRPSI